MYLPLYIYNLHVDGQTKKVWLFSREVYLRFGGQNCASSTPRKGGRSHFLVAVKTWGNSAVWPVGCGKLPTFTLSTRGNSWNDRNGNQPLFSGNMRQSWPSFIPRNLWFNSEIFVDPSCWGPKDTSRTRTKHRRKSTSMVAEVFLVQAGAVSENMIENWPRWNDCCMSHFLFAVGRIRIRKKQFSIDVDIFLGGRGKNSLPKQFCCPQTWGRVSTCFYWTGSSSSKDMKFDEMASLYISGQIIAPGWWHIVIWLDIFTSSDFQMHQ